MHDLDFKENSSKEYACRRSSLKYMSQYKQLRWPNDAKDGLHRDGKACSEQSRPQLREMVHSHR